MRINRAGLCIFILTVLSCIAVYADMGVYIIDVGQGDAIYIILPGGKTALIDGGPGAEKISKFIKEHQITKIDYLVLTHPDSDHYSGLKYVFTHCQVDNFYDTGVNNLNATGDDTVRRLAVQEGCPVVYPKEGDELPWDPLVTVRVLNASPTAVVSSDSRLINNASIVLQLKYGNESILLAGDIDSTKEEQLVSRYGDSLSSTVLKAAHHGSRYSSSAAFLGAVNPQEVYIEVGKNNKHRHPAQETLNRISKAGARIHRTDLSGTLSYTIRDSSATATTTSTNR